MRFEVMDRKNRKTAYPTKPMENEKIVRAEIGKFIAKNVHSTDGWVKKQPLREKKGRFSTVIPCFLSVLYDKIWTRAGETDLTGLWWPRNKKQEYC